MYYENGVRLLCSSQSIPPTITYVAQAAYNFKVYGLGIDYAIREGTYDNYNVHGHIDDFSAPMCRTVMSATFRWKADANLKNKPLSGQGTDRSSFLTTSPDRFVYKLHVLPTSEPEPVASVALVESSKAALQ